MTEPLIIAIITAISGIIVACINNIEKIRLSRKPDSSPSPSPPPRTKPARKSSKPINKKNWLIVIVDSVFRGLRRQGYLIAIFVLVFSSLLLIYPSLSWAKSTAHNFVDNIAKSDEDWCFKSSLEGKVRSQVQQIENSCARLGDKNSNSNAWKNAGRASLLLYEFEGNWTGRLERFKITKKYFEEADEAKNDPEIIFYKEFMKDFFYRVIFPELDTYKDELIKAGKISKSSDISVQDFIYSFFDNDDTLIFGDESFEDERYSVCHPVFFEEPIFIEDKNIRLLGIYNRSVEKYLSEDYEVKKDDFFILVELAHFLINRDTNHKLAAELLEKIPKEISKEDISRLKDIGLSQEEIQEIVNRYPEQYAQNVVYSLALSKVLSKPDEKDLENQSLEEFNASKLKEALDILEDKESEFGDNLAFNFYLANMYFQTSFAVITPEKGLTPEDKRQNFENAANEYRDILNKDAGGFYRAQRNLGLSLYLEALYSSRAIESSEVRESIKASELGNIGEYETALSEIDKALELAIDSEGFIQIESGDNLEILENIQEKLRTCTEDDECVLIGNDLPRKDGYRPIDEEPIRELVAGTSYNIIHEGAGDPFFEVEHDKFYCEALGDKSGEN